MVLAGLLACLALITGCAALLSNDETQILVENERESSYQLTVFQSTQESPGEIRFDVTTSDGQQQIVGLEELQTGTSYSNVSLHNPTRAHRVSKIRI